MSLKKFMSVVFVCAVVGMLLPASALGHGPEKGKNGGQLADAGSYHIEALAKGDTLTVYVTNQNDDNPILTTGFKGLAILVAGGKSLRIPLTPAGGNTLSGASATVIPEIIKGAIQITNEKNATVQAKF